MLRVAISEDDFRVASLHEKFLLEMDGVEVVFKALSAKETIEQLKIHDIDLLLLDIYLPDRLGVNIIHEIKSIQQEIGIILISAGRDKDIVKQALQKGIFDYIIKPVSLKRFVKAVEKFKQFKEGLDRKDEVDQPFLDNYFGQLAHEEENLQNTPKGIDPLTLSKVEYLLKENEKGITAEEMGVKMGASRTTARRYLEYLISENKCYAELEYGIVGRPERKYYRL